MSEKSGPIAPGDTAAPGAHHPPLISDMLRERREHMEGLTLVWERGKAAMNRDYWGRKYARELRDGEGVYRG